MPYIFLYASIGNILYASYALAYTFIDPDFGLYRIEFGREAVLLSVPSAIYLYSIIYPDSMIGRAPVALVSFLRAARNHFTLEVSARQRRLQGQAASRRVPPLEQAVGEWLQRLSVTGKPTSVAIEVGDDAVSIEVQGGSPASVVATRDIDDVSISLEMVIPPVGHPQHEPLIAAFSSEIALQVEKRLPRMTSSVREGVWDRRKRVAARRSAGAGISE